MTTGRFFDNEEKSRRGYRDAGEKGSVHPGLDTSEAVTGGAPGTPQRTINTVMAPTKLPLASYHRVSMLVPRR